MTSIFLKWKTTSIFWEMEDDLAFLNGMEDNLNVLKTEDGLNFNFFENERQHQSLKMEDKTSNTHTYTRIQESTFKMTLNQLRYSQRSAKLTVWFG